MADRRTDYEDPSRRWRDDDDNRERWQGREESRFADRSTRGSGAGPDDADFYGGSLNTDIDPRYGQSASRAGQTGGRREWRSGTDYGGGYGAAGYGQDFDRNRARARDEDRWDLQRREARRGEAERWRDRYEASRFSSDDYEPTRAGFDPYVRGYGGGGSTSQPGYGYGGREPEYTYGRDPDRSWWDHTKDRVAGAFGDDEARLRADHDSHRGYQSERGRYHGHGPKGYTRSDDRVREDVSDRLSDDSWLDASSIEVNVSGCDVTLSGTVRSRSDKRRAEDLAESVSGVKNVQNSLRVQSASTTDYGDTAVPTSTRAMGSTTGKVS